MDGGSLQQRIERHEAGRQSKARRVATHPLFSQQAGDPAQDQEQTEQAGHQQVIMDAVLKALSGHYAQQAVTHAKKGGSLGKVLSVAKKRATVKPAKKPVKPAAKKPSA
jgi:hypothetical protein